MRLDPPANSRHARAMVCDKHARLDTVYKTLDPHHRNVWADWVLTLEPDHAPDHDRSAISPPSTAMCP